MTTINLLSWRAKKQLSAKRQFFTFCVLSAFFALICNAIIFFMLQDDISLYEKRNTFLQERINQSQAMLGQTKQLKDKKENTISQLNVISDLHNQRYRVVELLASLTKFLPIGVFILDIDINEKQVKIQGESSSDIQVSQLITNLKTKKEWSDIKLHELTSKANKTDSKPKFYITFTME